MASPVGEAPRLAVLLPARNAEWDLPGWFESVERFADAVVALDDGSTDRTGELLAEHPLVQVLLTNPRRESYEGWDDRQNRQRLLDAAGKLAPEWVLYLDADERIPPDDAAALRAFLAGDALAGLAYGMRCYRMIGDLDHYDRNDLWVYRLFAHEPGLELPPQRLHLVPVPESIPRTCWVKTTIRIQHLGGLTEADRARRYRKYQEADPDAQFQSSYHHLLEPPGELRVFEPRPPDRPVLLATPDPAVEVVVDPGGPVLSAIVISKDDEDRIERTVRSVVEQECHEPFEVIVVTSGTDRTAAIVRERFPGVRVVELDHPALPGEARNAGLRFARGEYVSFPGSHVELPPGSLAARIRAHDEGWAMVTGATYNGNTTPVGWAAYFLDNSTALPSRPSGELGAPPAHCSYEARALFAAGGFPEDVRAGEDTRVNEVLFRSGWRAFRSQEVVIVHHNRARSIGYLVRHHLERGRAQVQFLRAMAASPEAGEARAREFLWAYPTRRLAQIDQNVREWGGDLRACYRRVRPLVRLGVLAAWVGAHLELRRPSTRGRARMGVAPADQVAGERKTASPRPSPLTQPLRLVRDRQAPLAGARLVFVHIPKTAGTALMRVIEREYEGEPIFTFYGDTAARVELLRSMPLEQRRRLRVVAGHVGFGVGRLLPGRNGYAVLLRDPVDRIVSHYYYTRSQSRDPMHDRALDGVESLEDYVCSSAFAPLVNNGQTRLIGAASVAAGSPADTEALAAAKAVLDRSDVVVGLQERFDESLLLFIEAFGWGLPAYRRVNVTPQRPSVAELPPGTVEVIRERNRLDVALYEYARARLERDLAALPDLGERLETLRLAGRYRATRR